MSREKVVDRVRKLLALASEEGGGTKAERDLALERAQELMEKHEIEEGELLQSKGREALPGIETEELGEFTQKEQWKGLLGGTIGHFHGVDCNYLTGPLVTDLQSKGLMGQRYRMVGRPEAMAYVKLVWQWLVPQLEAECTRELAHFKERMEGEPGWELASPGAKSGAVQRFQKAFYDGAILAIHQRLEERERAKTGPSTDLVRSDEEAKKEYYGDNRPTPGQYNLGEGPGRREGMQAGLSVDLDPGNKVDASERPELTP